MATSFSYTPPKAVKELLDRANRLGSDPKNTNYAGGNASAKAMVQDPSNGRDVEVMWVKGSGGDLGTLDFNGLAALKVDQLRALEGVYRGLEHEDEMVAAFDFCAFGKGGAAPSIDTAMHGLVEYDHVDHLHPDSGIAIATSANGRELTEKIFGDRVKFVDWRRPGFELGRDIAKIAKDFPNSIGVILGGHGITAWGSTSKECEENSLEIIELAAKYIRENGKEDVFGRIDPNFAPLERDARRKRAAELAPIIRGMASTDVRMVGHFKDDDVVLDFLSREGHLSVALRGTSCPDHFLRTKVRPLIVDTPADSPLEVVVARLKELHLEYRKEYSEYYGRYATTDSPPMRGADPTIFLVPGIGMFSFGKDSQTARVAGEFYINAINVITGAESISTYAPIDDSEKFRIEYWQLEEDKLKRMPKAKPLSGKVALVTGGGSGIGAATARRLSDEGAHVIVCDLDASSARDVAGAIGSSDKAVGVEINVADSQSIAQGMIEATLSYCGIDILVNNAGLSISKSLFETSEEDWDRQSNVMAKGSFLMSKAVATVMVEQGMGGDIVYVVSKNAVFAGPNNVAYGATKANQAHQVRLLAAELGQFGVRVNGVNPDGVVRGSKIFSSGWGAKRAAVYGVDESELGKYYASRTLLGKEVLPENIASAIFVLVSGDLAQTTGTHIPVDSGVASAFLR
ncbi:MAG: bifunctional aldolase/short-chain dehydrogenase [Actinomycetota bacterium]|nr:bifunctional aldolase/short-chain dehydrogenase [Actinomycetota bacterium]